MTHVRMFKPQFSNLVISGEKRQTVRPSPKRMPRPGDKISLRSWTGLPYRSKQSVLREAVISEVVPIEIHEGWGIKLNGQLLALDEEYCFARADGFNTPKEMFEWFAFEHGLPFHGVVIKWDNDPRPWPPCSKCGSRERSTTATECPYCQTAIPKS